MPLINYEVNLSLDWYKECVACSNVPDARATAFAKNQYKSFCFSYNPINSRQHKAI